MSESRSFPEPIGPFKAMKEMILDSREHPVAEVYLTEFRSQRLRVDDDVDESDAVSETEQAFARRIAEALNAAIISEGRT